MIHKAIQIALKMHANQVRKLGQDLYVTHPLEVGMLLAKYSLSDEVIAAGILHDTIEDTDLTLDFIEKEFGHIVASYVDACSEKNKSDPWITRKTDYLHQLMSAPDDVLYIVCADKLSNIKSIARNLELDGHQIWHRFNAGYTEQKWYYHAILTALSPINTHPLYVELDKHIKRVFST